MTVKPHRASQTCPALTDSTNLYQSTAVVYPAQVSPSPPSLPLFPLHCACSLQSNLLLSRQASVRLIWSFQVRRMEVKTEGNCGCEGDYGHKYTHKPVFVASVLEPHENSTKQDPPSVEKPQRRRSAKRHDCSKWVTVSIKFTISDSLTTQNLFTPGIRIYSRQSESEDRTKKGFYNIFRLI